MRGAAVRDRDAWGLGWTGAGGACRARAPDVRLVPRRWGARRGASLRIAGVSSSMPRRVCPGDTDVHAVPDRRGA